MEAALAPAFSLDNGHLVQSKTESDKVLTVSDYLCLTYRKVIDNNSCYL